MSEGAPLFELNASLDLGKLSKQFANDGRVQIRSLLTDETARTIRRILATETDWGLAWQTGESGPHSLRKSELDALTLAERSALSEAVSAAARSDDYAFAFHHYPMLDAYLGRWTPDSPHDFLLEYINDAPFLDLVRAVTGFPELVKADAQATLYAPGHFLAQHNDSHVGDGWRIAYVLNLGPESWRPEWGGYLMFYDQDGDVIGGYRPRFNSLNLFAVPQLHGVSLVAPYAPKERFAITGWLRDR
jgi:SM-20-related protein